MMQNYIRVMLKLSTVLGNFHAGNPKSACLSCPVLYPGGKNEIMAQNGDDVLVHNDCTKTILQNGVLNRITTQNHTIPMIYIYIYIIYLYIFYSFISYKPTVPFMKGSVELHDIFSILKGQSVSTA